MLFTQKTSTHAPTRFSPVVTVSLNSIYSLAMNIFWLSPNLTEACRWHVDSHVIKMPLEHCQLLSTAIHLSTTKVSPKTKIYKPTHANHPCSIWVRESLENWLLLRDFTLCLCKEYSFRYGRVHACQSVAENLPVPKLPSLGVTPLPLAMPDDVRNEDAFQAYRNLYTVHKRHLLKWKKRPRPTWSMTSNSIRMTKIAGNRKNIDA